MRKAGKGMRTIAKASVFFFLFGACAGVADTVAPTTPITPTTIGRGSSETEARKQPSVAPLKSGVVSTHAPFATGVCTLCHKDGKGGSPLLRPGNQTCYFCHEDVKKIMTSGKFQHRTASNCTNCHSPHNSAYPKLLLAKLPALCIECHVGIRKHMDSKVKHAALTTAASCTACHSPHASNVEKMLLRLPFEQCVGCHSTDDMTDSKGKLLFNFKKLFAENPIQHAPVAQKDCSSCHETHGSDNTRLLRAPYPAEFYAPFEVGNYALCFRCHDERIVTVKETTTDTRFRNGSYNLHYAHVNIADKGRICRACHEVHASKQPFLIREGVPYGSGGWILKIGYTKNPDGGICEKTCHTGKKYVNTLKSPAPATKGAAK
jgi:predicted CXXCH cytochrome family protein